MPKILIVDDNRDDLALVERGLRRSLGDLELRQASTAMELEQALGEGFDLVITDYHLGFSDGIRILRRVKALDADCPVIMFTLTGSEEIAVEAMKAGLEDYILKTPQHLVQLTNAVSHALKRKAESQRMREAEERLKESQSTFRLLFENNPLPMWVYDRETLGFLEVNRTALQQYGYSREEFLGMTLRDIRPQQDIERLEQETQQRQDQPYTSTSWQHRLKDGRIIDVEIAGHGFSYRGRPARLVAVYDITQRRQAEAALAAERTLLRTLIDTLPDLIYVKDPEGRFLLTNESAAAFMGTTPEGALGKKDSDFYLPSLAGRFAAEEQEVMRSGQSLINSEGLIHSAFGARRWILTTKLPLRNPQGQVVGLVGVGRDITLRRQAEEAQRQSEERFRTLAETAPASIVIVQGERLVYTNPATAELLGVSPEELRARPFWELMAPGQLEPPELLAARLQGQGKTQRFSLRQSLPSGGIRWLDTAVTPIQYDGQPALLMLSLDVTERQFYEQELELFERINLGLRKAESLRGMLEGFLDEVLRAFQTDTGSILIFDPKEGHLEDMASRGWLEQGPKFPLRPREGISGWVLSQQASYLYSDVRQDALTHQGALPYVPEGWAGATVPLKAGEEMLGVMHLMVPQPRQITPHEQRLLERLAEPATNALRRLLLRQQLERRVAQLSALRAIDLAITGAHSLETTLSVFLDQSVTQLGVDAATVLLYHPEQRQLSFAAGTGFSTLALRHTRLRLGQSYAGRAAQQTQLLHIPDLRAQPGELARSTFFAQEQFVAYWAIPLMARGGLQGVMELFHRAPLQPKQEWEGFLQALATQGAIALENARLLSELQSLNHELFTAYDNTIEALAAAVDLRDHETQGHSRRVTELTLRLAKQMGMEEPELLQVRRGALLHDIGKLGVPDAILLKPGQLTQEEWVEMKKHPTYAYEWLSKIAFLQSALEIPYAHHERWDGLGYPRGLSDQQIPLAARIFAVIDVYDALTSNRPYRAAWSQERTLEYLREQAGKQFDPQVVEAFLEMLAQMDP